ncbi:DUF3265 domain-containing protein [Vibrio genomosp. F6]|nr:DUF3265 domain-containing protein [Vibrio genomosp. F6]TKF24338.1 DUF3265 domain-containing protein [Vibrio genomosp. F6]
MTSPSRGTVNACFFYHTMICVVVVLCGRLVLALSAP